MMRRSAEEKKFFWKTNSDSNDWYRENDPEMYPPKRSIANGNSTDIFDPPAACQGVPTGEILIENLIQILI